MNALSPATLGSDLIQLEQRLDLLIKNVGDFKIANPNCFTKQIPQDDLLQVAETARFFSEKMGGFASEAIDIQQRTIQILDRLKGITNDPELSSTYAKEIGEFSTTASTISTKTLTLFQSLQANTQ
ncbi:MAG: hypothetical protein KR126chlam3_01415 [Chlamydiae bacterium]|nr:hypothetical protein [Chlamydiota bacterium]